MLELPEERTDVPLERMLELLLERTLELLLERMLELLLERLTADEEVERVALETLDALPCAEVERTGVVTALLELRLPVDTALAREADPLLRETVPVVRFVSPRPTAVVIRSLARTLLLPKVREAAAVLRLETRVAAPLLLSLTRVAPALRTAAERERSKPRALVILRLALREANERSG